MVKEQISNIMLSLGFRDMNKFYQHLQHDSFYITDKDVLISELEKTDRTVRQHLAGFSNIPSVPPVYAMEQNER